MRRVIRWCVPAVVAGVVAASVPALASTPPSHTVTVPPAGTTTTVTWTGTIPPGVNPASRCTGVPGTEDDHTIELQVPAGLYDSATAEATFKIRWGDAGDDEILSVTGPDGSTGSSDGSSNSEMVILNDPKPGTYTVSACPFAATAAEAYTGELTIRTSSRGAGEPSLPAADAQGLSFSPTVPADPQRDESEPEIRVDDDGNAVSCGPTGFSGASDYAQISTDGGDQFHLIGEEPRGQQGSGGGGDCGLAFGVQRNGGGKFQYAYTGLGPLTGFTTSTSPDNGHTITTAGPQGNGNTAKGGLADRQWMAFLDADTVLLSYNQQVPRNIVVQRSDNGGLTYNDVDPDPDRQGVIASASPDFPGPMHSMPARFVDPSAPAGEYVAFYGWNASAREGPDDFSYVNFAISEPGSDGLVWHNCRVAKIPADDGGLGAFTVADNDIEGNVYLTYADTKAYHSYLTTLTRDKLAACDGANTDESPDLTNPGWSAPVQVDRGNVRSTVFPWLAANGEPGRVAIAFYGTESDGDPNTGAFKASWDVYVNQSLDALSATPSVSQVKATTHPFHYDSICLNGLGCDLAAPPGDRSLADFFAIDYDPKTKKLMVVYDQSAKQPDEATGRIATPAVVTQTGGPSNGGGTVTPDTRPVVRDESADPAGDATADFSNTNSGSPSPVNVPAMDFRSQKVSPEVDPATGAPVADGGFTVTLKLADLSDGALSDALSATKSGSLLWIFRFVNGYTASAASARWSPGGGFSFGYNDYTTGSAQCGSSGDKCQLYPGDQALKGKVDQAAGTITLSVPRSYLKGLSGPTGPGQRPAAGKAAPGTRFYDATAFTLGNVSPNPTTQSFLYPIDNPPAMDFLLPAPAAGTAAPGGSGAGTGPARGSGPSAPGTACAATAGFRSVSVTPRGRGLRFRFVRRQPDRTVTVDVFRVSQRGRVLDQRRVARFANRSRGFDWNGRSNGRLVGPGYYFARLAVPTSGGRSERRRVTLQKTGGRFARRPAFALRERCGTLQSFKLVRPVFGGRTGTPLSASYRLGRRARVSLRITRGTRTVRRYKARTRAANRTFRIRVPARALARGEYRVRIAVVRGRRTTRGAITGRRL